MNGIGYGITPFMGSHGILARSSGGGGGAFVNEYSMSFDGVDEYMTVGYIAELNNASAFTYSGWYKFNQVPDRASIFSILVDNNNFFDILMYDALTYVNLRVGGVAQYVQFNSNFFTQNQWSHIVVAYDNSKSTNREKLKVYIDNVDIFYAIANALTSALPTGTNTVTIGDTTRSSGVQLNGKVDECAVFSTQLSASDVATIYNSGVPNDISSLNPLSWWRMGDGDTWNGSTWTLTDNGSGGNDATSVNMEEGDRVTDVP